MTSPETTLRSGASEPDRASALDSRLVKGRDRCWTRATRRRSRGENSLADQQPNRLAIGKVSSLIERYSMHHGWCSATPNGV